MSKMDLRHSKGGQTAIEYLLLFALASFVAFLAFMPGGFLEKAHITSNKYYAKVANAIMGDYPHQDPKPIDGGWCPYSLCVKPGTSHFRTCECPAPAFGGKNCVGNAWEFCSAPDTCGDNLCTGTEACSGTFCPPGVTCTTCQADCCKCGDGECTAGRENCNTCPTDCGCPSGVICTAGGTCCSEEDDTAFCARSGRCRVVTAPDNCGLSRTVSCPDCPAGQVCTDSNVCCTPEDDAAFCSRSGTCGGAVTAPDNCGTPRTTSCSCPAGSTCDPVLQRCCSPNPSQECCDGTTVCQKDSCGNVLSALPCGVNQVCQGGACVCPPKPTQECCDASTICQKDACGNVLSALPCECGCSAGACSAAVAPVPAVCCGSNICSVDKCGVQTVTQSCASNSCSNGACDTFNNWCVRDGGGPAQLKTGSVHAAGCNFVASVGAPCDPYCGFHPTGASFVLRGETWTCLSSPNSVAENQANCN